MVRLSRKVFSKPHARVKRNLLAQIILFLVSAFIGMNIGLWLWKHVFSSSHTPASEQQRMKNVLAGDHLEDHFKTYKPNEIYAKQSIGLKTPSTKVRKRYYNIFKNLNLPPKFSNPFKNPNSYDGHDTRDDLKLASHENININNILIGVMTNQHNLADRTLSILRTWGKSVCGVASNKNNTNHDSQKLSNRNDRGTGIKLLFMGESAMKPSNIYCLDDEITNGRSDSDQVNFQTRQNDYKHPKGCLAHAKSNCFVSLKEVHAGVVDYPPMVKAFAMFKYMYENYVSPRNEKNFEWFIRLDDDVYANFDKIRRFLNLLDPNKPYYIGQMGVGRENDRKTKEYFRFSKKLHAIDGTSSTEPRNFCMGGTGIILSRSVLSKIGPFIARCLNQTVSVHDDVEIGRCIYRYAKIECTWSYEGSKIFFNNYQNNPIVSQIYPKEAIIIHPLKEPDKMYKLRHEILVKKAELLYTLRDRLKSALLKSTKLQSSMYAATELDNVPTYSAISKSINVFHTPQLKNPHISVFPYMKSYLKSALNEVFTKLQTIYEIPYNPVDDKLPKIPTHLYMQWQKPKLQYPNVTESFAPGSSYHDIKCMIGEMSYDMDFQSVVRYHELDYRFKYRDAFLFAEPATTGSKFGRKIKSTPIIGERRPEIINIIVPFSTRYSTLQRFLRNYELLYDSPRYASSNIQTTLNVIAFIEANIKPSPYGSDNASTSKLHEDARQRDVLKLSISALNEKLKTKTSNRWNQEELGTLEKNDDSDRNVENVKVFFIYGSFSRALALEYGATLFDPDDLLVFIDVDMLFDASLLRRVSEFTSQNSSAYFPIVFSRFKNNQTIGPLEDASTLATIFRVIDYERDGFWNIYGYGMTAIYKSDFDRVGGFNMDIRGWGMEDVDFFNKLLRSNSRLRIYRTAEPSLLHVYHERKCPDTLDDSQYKMCLDSMASYESNGRYVAQNIINAGVSG